MAAEDDLLDAVTALVPPLLNGMEALSRTARYLHPPQMSEVIAQAVPYRQPVADGLGVFNTVDWPEHLQRFKAALGDTATNTLKAFDGLDGAAAHSNPVMAAYSALRYSARAQEALYPVTAMLPPVSRFFLLASAQEDEALLARVAEADPSREEVGVIHAGNASDERGGFSLFVPEYYSGEAMPLVITMHGGSGHGRGSLWGWVRAARSLGLIVLSPTSQDRTWSLMGPDVDSPALLNMLSFIDEHWNVDKSRVLLSGMSDGGTFSYVAGLQDDVPYTHLAPIAASFHPMLLEVASESRVRDLPIYLTHGALDWMFDVEIARTAAKTFEQAGANLVYREIDDLSHTYPTEENELIAKWLLEG